MRLTFAGHFNPLLVLAKAARDDGHKVEFITGPRKHAMLASAGIDAPILTSSGPDTLEAIANTKSPVSGNPIKTESVTVRPFVGYGFEDYDAIIHHGGAGVTYAAILASLPSLVIPRDYDQFDYAARIVHHKPGLRHTSIADSAERLTRLLDRAQWPALERFQQHAQAYSPLLAFPGSA